MALTLLLADDSVTTRRLVERAFGDAGMRVVVVRTGPEAIDCITRDRPAVVLADANLAERNGYELAAHVSRIPELSHIPVVLLAGAFDQVDERRVQAAGCAAVLSKPFEPHMAVALVEDLLAARGAQPGAAHAAAGPAPTAARPVPVPSSSSLDEYFDRLDEALSGPPASHAATAAPAAVAVVEPAAEPPAPPAPSPAPPARPGVSLHEAFTQLLEDELGITPAPSPVAGPAVPSLPESGDPLAAEAAAPPASTAPAPAPALDAAGMEALVEAVTGRVIERLGDTYVRTLVSAAVREAAERLVRETIDRIATEG